MNLMEVVLRHGGEAPQERDALAAMPAAGRQRVSACTDFFHQMAPRRIRSAIDRRWPFVSGHGSVKPTALFNEARKIE
jgi:hypothetical protein